MTNQELALKIVSRNFARIEGTDLVFETLNNTSRLAINNLKEEIKARCDFSYWTDTNDSDAIF